MNIQNQTAFGQLLLESSQFPKLPTRSYVQKGLQINETELSSVLARKYNLKNGSYVNISPSNRAKDTTIISVLGFNLQKLARRCGVNQGKVLVVGLGNKDFVVDALGNMCVQKIAIGGDNYIKCTISPQVSAVTGISSFDIIRGVISSIKPQLVLAIDTLSTQKLDRLGNCYQLTTSGISPGGGVGNPQPTLDKNSLGVPVIAIGVPLIINVGSIYDSDGLPTSYAHYQVTPRDVDALCEKTSTIISTAINNFFV